MHVGSHLGDGLEAGLTRIQGELDKVLADLPDGVWLLLENTAGAGGTIGRTVDELAAVIERSPHPRLGVCLDSCHLFASGIEISDPAAMTALLDEIDEKIGLDRLRALHLNDSQVPFGSNRDRHAPVGDGLIGEGLAAFLGHPRLQGLACVLETPVKDGKSIDAEALAPARRLHEAGVCALLLNRDPGDHAERVAAARLEELRVDAAERLGAVHVGLVDRARTMVEGILAALERAEAAVGGRGLEMLEIDARREDALTARGVQTPVDADLGVQVGTALLEAARRVHHAIAVDSARPALGAILEGMTTMRREARDIHGSNRTAVR